jgi:hypothetical protein
MQLCNSKIISFGRGDSSLVRNASLDGECIIRWGIHWTGDASLGKGIHANCTTKVRAAVPDPLLEMSSSENRRNAFSDKPPMIVGFGAGDVGMAFIATYLRFGLAFRMHPYGTYKQVSLR